MNINAINKNNFQAQNTSFKGFIKPKFVKEKDVEKLALQFHDEFIKLLKNGDLNEEVTKKVGKTLIPDTTLLIKDKSEYARLLNSFKEGIPNNVNEKVINNAIAISKNFSGLMQHFEVFRRRIRSDIMYLDLNKYLNQPNVVQLELVPTAVHEFVHILNCNTKAGRSLFGKQKISKSVNKPFRNDFNRIFNETTDFIHLCPKSNFEEKFGQIMKKYRFYNEKENQAVLKIFISISKDEEIAHRIANLSYKQIFKTDDFRRIRMANLYREFGDKISMMIKEGKI